MSMTVGSLFSGIGGMDLGLERAGMRIKWMVEVDDFCTKVLTKHWPDVPKFGDIRNVGKRELETVDLVAGGFPCQDISYAGVQGRERKLFKGDLSSLFFEFARIAKELQPTWLIIENTNGVQEVSPQFQKSIHRLAGNEIPCFHFWL